MADKRAGNRPPPWAKPGAKGAKNGGVKHVGGRAKVVPTRNSAKHNTTGMQERFLQEYLKDPKLNGYAAAEKAGYANPAQAAHRLLRTPEVRDAIQEEMDKRAARCSYDADKVLVEIAKMAFSNIMDYMRVQDDGTPQVDLTGLTRDKGAAIQEVTVDTYVEGRGEDAREVKRVRFKLADKVKTLELLGKHLRLFSDKVEVTGANGKDLIPEMSENEVARRIAFVLAKGLTQPSGE